MATEVGTAAAILAVLASPLVAILARWDQTGPLGSSALAPVLYGRLGDATGPVWAAGAAAVTALAVVPLMLLLSLRLAMPTGA